MRIEVLGGRLLDPAQGLDEVSDLFIENGLILARGSRPEGFQAERSIDARGLWVLPGLIDLCASLNSELKARLATEVRAAVRGGVTSLCCPPDGSPVNDSGGATNLIRDLAREQGLARVFPIGALTRNLEGEQLSEMNSLKQAGCRLVSNLRRPMKSSRILRRALEYARSQDITLVFCPEDHALAADGCVHEGFVSTRLGLVGIPEVAETLAVAQLLLLVEDTGVRAHFSQLSTARAVEMIADARARGLPVTADTTIYHLLLTDAAVDGFDSRYHLRPPLRTEADREGLRRGVREGVLQAICSQHEPHESAAKWAPFAETKPGMIGLETLLPLALRLVEEGALSLSRMVEALTAGPAAVLGLELGSLRCGRPADLCLLDPQAEWVLTERELASACQNTPYLGQSFKGRVRYTLVEGRVVHELAG